MIRIAYVPRHDALEMRGGDYLHTIEIGRQLQKLDVELTVASLSELETASLPDFVYMSQSYQIEHGEKVAQWTQNHHVPLVISPLYEDELSLWYGSIANKRSKWQLLASRLGHTVTESLYRGWHSIKRFRDQRWQRQRSLLQSAWLLPNSQAELQHLASWFNLSHLRSFVVPLGVDTAIYGAASTQPNTSLLPEAIRGLAGQYVLQVGMISHRKNQLGLLSALMNTALPVVLLGRDSPYETEYAQAVQTTATQHTRVTLIRHVELPALLALYRNAAVHVMPSWSERPGLVSLEAAACGSKTVATTRSTLHEYLGDRAFYCDPIYPGSIRNAINAALAAPARQDTAAYVLERYNWSNTAQQFRSALEFIRAHRHTA